MLAACGREQSARRHGVPTPPVVTSPSGTNTEGAQVPEMSAEAPVPSAPAIASSATSSSPTAPGTQTSSASPLDAAVPCGRETTLGDSICCGREGELINVSCVDLSDGGTIYGRFGRCHEQGEIYDARFAGGVCCEPLVGITMYVPSAEADGSGGLPVGCWVGGEGVFMCSACGDGVCQEVENWCNCATDCDKPGDAGVP
jgi:hypothetical protein